MTYNTIGLCIQPQAKDFNRAKCIEHVRAANYLTCQVLDDQQLAIDLGIPYAVFRDYNMEPQPGTDPAGVARQTMAKIREIAARPGGRNILYYVNNEPAWSKARNDMYAYMIEESANDPGSAIGLCVGNYGVGTIKSGQGADPNWWDTPDAELLLKTLHKYRDVKLPNGSYAFVLGLDEYTGLFPWIASNGAEKRLNPQWEHRPSIIDILKDQWHLLRALQGILKACKRLGILPPHCLIEEAVIDGVNDVIYTFGNPATEQHNLQLAVGATKPQGWRTLIPQYSIWYPGKDPEDVLADFHIWVWETVYAPFAEFIIAMTIYCAWDASGDGEGRPANKWKWFRVDNAPKYLKRMEAYRWTKQTPQPDPEEPPVPEPPVSDLPTTGWVTEDVKVFAWPTPAHIYKTRDGGEIVGTLTSQAGIPAETVYLFGVKRQPVKCAAGTGWLDRNNGWFVPNEPPFDIKPNDSRWQWYTAEVNAQVSVRAQPGKGAILGTLKTGDLVKSIYPGDFTDVELTYLTRVQGRFSVVRLESGITGFVLQNTVVFKPLVEAPTPARAIAQIGTNFINIRSGAGINFNDIGNLHNADEVYVLGKAEASDGLEWLNIRRPSYGDVPTVEGWVRASLISALRHVPTSEAIPPGMVLVNQTEYDALHADRVALGDLTSKVEAAENKALELQSTIAAAPAEIIEAVMEEVTHRVNNSLMPVKVQADNLVSELAQEEE